MRLVQWRRQPNFTAFRFLPTSMVPLPCLARTLAFRWACWRRSSPRAGYEGPFLVVDCPQLDDVYSIIVHREEVIEVGWQTAQEWGIQSGGWQVTISRIPPAMATRLNPVRLDDWFLERVEFYPQVETLTLDPRPIYRSPSTWRLYGKWTTFEAPTWSAWEHGR